MSSIEHRSPERIVVGIDGSLASRAAVRWAVQHAQPGDTVVLFHSWQVSRAMVDAGLCKPDDDTAARTFASRELARAQALPHGEGVVLTSHLEHGDVKANLPQQAADLLVVGARGSTGLVGALLGSASTRLARHCSVPVVIVPCPAPHLT